MYPGQLNKPTDSSGCNSFLTVPVISLRFNHGYYLPALRADARLQLNRIEYNDLGAIAGVIEKAIRV